MIGTQSLLAGAMGAGPLDWSPWLHRREPQDVAGGDRTMEIIVGRREVSGRGER